MDIIESFDHGHADLVLACHKSFDGSRLVTASADHRLKVFDRQEDGTDQLVDTWTAHDAEILDVKWNSPLTIPLLASISEDLTLRVWLEDPTLPPLSGRRFRPVYTQAAPHKVPYVSIDFLTNQQDLSIYLAMIDRSGYLSIIEPVIPDDPSTWQPVDEFNVCRKPLLRGEETGFLVRFHQDAKFGPSSLARSNNGMTSHGYEYGVTLAVAAMDEIKIYGKPYGAAQFSHLETLPIDDRGTLVRDIAWAGGMASAVDIIACASQDGLVRIWEINQIDQASGPASPDVVSGGENKPNDEAEAFQTGPAPSGIGAGLAVTSRIHSPLRSVVSETRNRYKVNLVALLRHPQVRRVCFSPTGGALATAGDDGELKIWRPAIKGRWMEFWETAIYKKSKEDKKQ